MTTFEVIALIVSGVFVGFINTLAGGGTIISLSLFMFMGLPADVANGTNRIAVILQNFTSTVNFKRQKLLDTKKGLRLMIPTVIGAIAGAQLSVEIDEETFKIALGLAMIMMVYFMIVKPDKWINGQKILQDKKVSKLQYFIFFLIGIYGGFVQVGVGYFLLAGIVLGAGYDLIRANAIKGFIVMFYTIFALIVFVLNDKVHWQYGLIHSLGNITGAFIASRYALTWGAAFIRWFIIGLILITSADLFGFIDLRQIFA
jgi:uncharacterized membrane protein YfcA